MEAGTATVTVSTTDNSGQDNAAAISAKFLVTVVNNEWVGTWNLASADGDPSWEGVYCRVNYFNPEICNQADERRSVRPSNLPCESMPLHNRVLECAWCKGIANDEARHLVLERVR